MNGDAGHPAERLLEQGRALYDAKDITGAEAAYRSALALAPHWSVPHFNLGLLCKYEGRWQESFDFNLRALQLTPDDMGAWWNMGIAATVLGRWADARRAWEQFGIADPGGPDPPRTHRGEPRFGWIRTAPGRSSGARGSIRRARKSTTFRCRPLPFASATSS